MSYSKASLYPYARQLVANQLEETFATLRYTLGGDRPSQTSPLALFLIQLMDQG